MRDVVCSVLYEAVTNAEHTEANLLPCNAAVRLQARAEGNMSPIAELDQRLEQIIREFAMRIAVPRWSEFDTVWEAAIRVCDRYELGKSRRAPALSDETGVAPAENLTSSAEPSADDAPAQTHPPVAA